MSNIPEGLSRQTDKEFIQFLYVAEGSTAELQSQLYVAIDLKHIAEADFRELYDLSDLHPASKTGYNGKAVFLCKNL